MRIPHYQVSKSCLPQEQPKESISPSLLNLPQYWPKLLKAYLQSWPSSRLSFQFNAESITFELKMETFSILSSQPQVRAGRWANPLPGPLILHVFARNCLVVTVGTGFSSENKPL